MVVLRFIRAIQSDLKHPDRVGRIRLGIPMQQIDPSVGERAESTAMG